jgi:hypothetical protein
MLQRDVPGALVDLDDLAINGCDLGNSNRHQQGHHQRPPSHALQNVQRLLLFVQIRHPMG